VHEFALAEGVAVTAVEAARREGLRRITRLAVSVGELQQFQPELFAEVLREIMPLTHAELAGVELDLRTVPAALRCRACGRQFGLRECAGDLDPEQSEAVHFLPELAHAYLRCPDCGSPDFEIERGRGIWLDQVEGIT
jgi:hydrogenase nickel incorporation protein HypA/HybF